MHTLDISIADYTWIEEEIYDAYKNLSKKEKVFFNTYRLKKPIIYKLAKFLITDEDDSFFVVLIYNMQVILFDDIEELFSIGIINEDILNYSGTYTSLSECIQKIDSKDIKDSNNKYFIEIKFQSKKLFANKLNKLEDYKKLINQSNILGKSIEHDSVHYIENIYYKWMKNDIKIKLYIDDYGRDDSLCIDIFLDKKKFTKEFQQIIKLLENDTIDMKITKNWKD